MQKRTAFCPDFKKAYGRADLPCPLRDKRLRLGPEPSSLAQSQPQAPSGKGPRFGSFDLWLPRHLSRQSHFPSWMQKGLGSALLLQAVNEKTLEANGHLARPGQSRRPLLEQVRRLRRPKRASASKSSSELEEQLQKIKNWEHFELA